jgi:hypothetical protein
MRRWIVPVAIGLLALAAASIPERARAQEPAARQEFHLGAGSCAAQACHGGAEETRQEYKIWATRDRHSRAYESLTGELGQRIGKRLDLRPTEAPECLSCHGTTGVQTAATFDPADGVSCELCHGGAQKWLGPHVTPSWKRLTPAAKAARGFRDLTTPAKRAAACVGCHVAEKGRDITHAIMAAGHPPLVFDTAKFLEDLPPHWTDEEDLRVATWVEGLKANAAAVLGHVARTARSGPPDFTVFDCHSCHHVVYTGSVYEKSASPGRPGELPLELSSLEVLLVAAGDETLLKRFRPILTATYAPGDSTEDLADYAGKAAAEVARLFPDARTFGRTHAAEFLANLDAHLERVAAGGTRTPRAEMQQIALAIHALAARREDAFRTAFAELDRALARTAPYDPVACARAARAVIAAAR